VGQRQEEWCVGSVVGRRKDWRSDCGGKGGLMVMLGLNGQLMMERGKEKR
jgi:hypothetical protein